ncbi:MAG TPA: outer-membrane lipoprotein carrier protein LolA, partial [Acidobacteriaceae bacterium]|nr:outer-membrane lipoprotein carrier protein LolA [Acidobacteriaceae bacterium]
LGHTRLEKELTGLAIAPAPASPANDTAAGFTLTGVPKEMAQRIKSLALTVTADGIIRGIRLEETDGSVTEFTFTGIHENVPTTDRDFSFLAPAGVDIVNGMPPI